MQAEKEVSLPSKPSTLPPVLSLPPEGCPTDPLEPGRVTDGDTATVAGESVRFLHINTPELGESWAFEGADFLEEMIGGNPVSLSGECSRDGYGRLLAEVFSSEGKNTNLELVRAGLAHVFLFPPYPEGTAEKYLAAEAEARSARLGIWSGDPRYAGSLHITSFHADPDGADSEDLNGEYIRLANISGMDLDLEGYRLTDQEEKNSYTFPPVLLRAGHQLKISVGSGENKVDPNASMQLYWGSDVPVFNNDGDTATLWDREGHHVDKVYHPVRELPHAEQLPPPASGRIAAEDAIHYIGETLTVEGIVVWTEASGTGKVCKVAFSDDRRGFLVATFPYAKFAMPGCWDGSLVGKAVAIRGKIKFYKGAPEIIVNKSSQVTMGDAEAIDPFADIVLSAGVLTPEQASDHIGETTTVGGRVLSVYISSSKKVCKLNLSADYKTGFSVTSFSGDKAALPGCWDRSLEGKILDVSGTIEAYQGATQIVVNEGAQVFIHE